MKTAILFPGQGAQKLGMARDFYENFDSVREKFDRASELLGYDLRALIDGDEARLNATEFTQPAVLVTSLAIYDLLSKAVKPDLVAGLSLGEYSALVAAGALDFDAAVKLVAARGKFMAEACPTGVGKMVAVMNADAGLIEEICQAVSRELSKVVSPANYNTPQQIVIGGEIEAVDEAVRRLTDAGVKRCITLNTSGPFHTALLKPASDQLSSLLATVKFDSFKIPLVSNTTAELMTDEAVKPLLTRQVMSAVKWYEGIETMRARGVTRFIEVGPGKTLTGFNKRIDKDFDSISVETMEDLSDFRELKFDE